MEQIHSAVTRHRDFFLSGKTKDLSFRIQQLKKLQKAIKNNEKRIFSAMKHDLGKSPYEAYSTEVGLVYEEIQYQMRHLRKWARPRRVRSDVINIDARSFIHYEPFGTVLIMAPWNYPFNLVFAPLAGALAAGNCAVVKPADYSKEVTDVICDIINEAFDPSYVSVFTGDRTVNQALLEERYDLVFFTGSPSLGRYVMEKASKNLTPVVLELGGKSPAIVDEDADIAVAARRIAFGRFLNSGQTCIAPDYAFVHESVKDAFIKELQVNVKDFFGEDASKSPDYGRIINARQHDRLKKLLATGKLAFGGSYKDGERYIEPSVMIDVKGDDPVMREEIFGPILPIMTFTHIDDVVSFVNAHEKPLALYYFSKSRWRQRDVMLRTTSGGMCINDTLMHQTNPRLPFGGVGNSGMGRYHGAFSFETFSNRRSVIARSAWFDPNVRYMPYKKSVFHMARRIFEKKRLSSICVR